MGQQDISELARLGDWFSQNVEGYSGPLRLEAFSGGQSNPTFRVCAASGDYVLRRKPMGDILPSAHAVDREFRVLKALGGTGVPVPHVHALCADESIIGSMFYVMDLVPGRIFWDPRLPEFAPHERSALFDSMNETIARIHSLDPQTHGLGDFGRTDGYIARQVSRWTRQYRASETTPDPAMDSLIAWLPEHMPPEGRTGIVHGDYRLDNLIVHPTEPRIIAVLDWELSTLGDPMADMAYHALAWRFSPALFRGLAGADLAALGIPSEADYLAAYLRRTEFEAPENWEFYLILSMFRIAAILQGIVKRALDGSAANADAAEVGAKARPIAALAWELANGRAGSSR